ncbi:hypothetical protein [Stenotrophomonas maltophilia]|uniref:hypothetical protein n=1 Tax=Stenotrophomonas maltophilia TaxID=40324 RepID=UPI0021AD9FAD|nr:hypothetical protein [Stenotrophomonas maltophilia]
MARAKRAAVGMLTVAEMLHAAERCRSMATPDCHLDEGGGRWVVLRLPQAGGTGVPGYPAGVPPLYPEPVHTWDGLVASPFETYKEVCMLSAVLIAALAASPAAPVPYADCLLGNIQPGLSDRAVQLVQEACAAKHPESFAAAMELVRRTNLQRLTYFEAAKAEAARSANAAATAAQEAADAAAAKAKNARTK